MTHRSADYAQVCLDHLACEEKSLQNIQRLMGELRTALRAGTIASLTGFSPASTEISALQVELERQREQFRSRFSDVFGIPDRQVTIGSVMARLDPPWDVAVREARRRVVDLASEVQQMSRRLQATLAWFQRFTQSCLKANRRPGFMVDRYGPTGECLVGGHPQGAHR